MSSSTEHIVLFNYGEVFTNQSMNVFTISIYILKKYSPSFQKKKNLYHLIDNELLYFK